MAPFERGGARKMLPMDHLALQPFGIGVHGCGAQQPSLGEGTAHAADGAERDCTHRASALPPPLWLAPWHADSYALRWLVKVGCRVPPVLSRLKARSRLSDPASLVMSTPLEWTADAPVAEEAGALWTPLPACSTPATAAGSAGAGGVGRLWAAASARRCSRLWLQRRGRRASARGLASSPPPARACKGRVCRVGWEH